MVFSIWPSLDAMLFSISVDDVAFYSKKAAFGGSYPGYVKDDTCGVGSCCNGVGFIGMN